jgi:hypothetical protein
MISINELHGWEIYDLSAITAETVWIDSRIGISFREHRSNFLRCKIMDVPIWDCQSIHLRSKTPPSEVWNVLISMDADLVGISIKSPIMGDLFTDYLSYFSQRAGYIRQISPRILKVDRNPDEIWRESLDKKARNAVRRAEKSGVKVERIDPADHIDDIVECNRSKRGVPPCYTDRKCVAEEIEENKIKFGGGFQPIGAFLKDKLVGYAYIIFVSRDLALFSKFFINYNFGSMSIGELLLWHGIKEVAGRVRFLQYGSWSRYHSGLDMFLEHFGFSKEFKTLNIYIPLSKAGKMLLLQKKAVNRVINSGMLVKLSQNRFMRDRWYLLKSIRKRFT